MAGGEGSRVAFVRTAEERAFARIGETVCALANDIEGSGLPGIVVVNAGIDGKVAETVATDCLLQRLSRLRSDGHVLPPPTILVEKRTHEGSEVGVVTVPPSDSPPVRYRGLVHVRVGSHRRIATAREERILNERRRYGSRPFDISPIPGTDPSDLRHARFEEDYLPRAMDPAWLRAYVRTASERLAVTKMIASAEDQRATILGLLVLGNRPRDIVPGAYVQFLRVAGYDLSDPIADDLAVEGTISDLSARVEDKLRSHNRRSANFTGSFLERRREAYPLAALQRLFRNALMHRDYEVSNAPVRVTWFDDRIEIQNPGGPFGNVTERNFGKPGSIDYRNPNLAGAM